MWCLKSNVGDSLISFSFLAVKMKNMEKEKKTSCHWQFGYIHCCVALRHQDKNMSSLCDQISQIMTHTHTKPLCKYRSCAPFFSSQQDTGKHGSCMRNIQVFLNCFKGKLGWAYVVKLKWAKFVHVNITSVWIKVYQLFSSEQLWHRPQFWEPTLSLSRGGCKAVWSADHTKESWSLTKSRL